MRAGVLVVSFGEPETPAADQVVSFLELRDPAQRDHAQLAGQGSPVTRMPA